MSNIMVDISVADYRKQLAQNREPVVKRATVDKYLKAIREAYESNDQVYGWRPRVKFITSLEIRVFELFIKVVALYGFSEGSNKFGQNLDKLDRFEQEIEELWISHKPY